DDHDVLRILTTSLEGAGYEVVGATSVRDALAAMQGDHFDGLVLDRFLGHGSRAEQILAVAPTLPYLIISGNPEGQVDLLKPFTRDELLATVAAMLQPKGQP